jgi:hypothetical protein
MTNIATSVGNATIVRDPTRPKEWQDLVHIINNSVAAHERAYGADVKGQEPHLTEPFAVAKTIVWDFIQHTSMVSRIKNLDENGFATFLRLMDDKSKPAWPLEIIWETISRNKYPCYRIIVKSDPASPEKTSRYPEATYEQRESVPGRANFVYPGFTMHLKWSTEASYYSNSIPFGAILDTVRTLTLDGRLPQRMGTELGAVFIFIYYEIVMATYDYYVALDKYYSATTSRPNDENTFLKFDTHLRSKAAGTDKTWFEFLQTGHREAKHVCEAFYNNLGDTRRNNVFGIDPEDLVKNPDQISGILERYLGIKGLGLDTLKNLPGVSDLLSGLSANKSAPNPTAIR